MPLNLDSCITGIFVPGNIGASSGQTPVQPIVPSLTGMSGRGVAAGVGAAVGVSPGTAGTAAGIGSAAGVGTAVPWVVTFSQTLDLDSLDWNGYNMRQVIEAAALSQSGTKVRLTLQAANGQGAQIGAIYLGHKAASGDPYDFDGNQVQVTVGASPTFTITAGTSVVTDPVVFTFDNTKDFIVAIYLNNSAADDVRGRNVVTNAMNWYKSTANETATSNVTGYANIGVSSLRLVNKVEVQ